MAEHEPSIGTSDDKPPAQPHRLREATPEQAVEVMNNDWLSPIGGKDASGRVWKDSGLPRRKRVSNP